MRTVQAISFSVSVCVCVRVCKWISILFYYFYVYSSYCCSLICFISFCLSTVFSFLLHLQSVGYFSYAFFRTFFCLFFFFFVVFYLVKACINIFVYKDITLRIAFCKLGQHRSQRMKHTVRRKKDCSKLLFVFFVVWKVRCETRLPRVSHKEAKAVLKKRFFLKTELTAEVLKQFKKSSTEKF